MKRIILITLALVLIACPVFGDEIAIFKIEWKNGVPDLSGFPDVDVGTAANEPIGKDGWYECWIRVPDKKAIDSIKKIREFVKDVPDTGISQ